MNLYLRLVFKLFLSLVFVTEAALFLEPSLSGITLLIKVPLILIMAFITIRLMTLRYFYENKHLLFLLGIFIYSLILVPFSQFPSIAFTASLKLGYFFLMITSFIYLIQQNIIRFNDLRFLVILAFIIFIPVGIYMTLFPAVEHLAQVGPSYTLLWIVIMAVFLLNKNDYLMRILIVLAILTILISFKRGAVICLILSFLVYGFLLLYKQLTMRRLTYFFIIPFLILALGLSALNINGDFIIDRLLDADGSGREMIYLLIFNALGDASIFQLFFGHGFLEAQIHIGEVLGIRTGAQLGLQAHSDWLTLLFEQGFIGFILFVGFHSAFFWDIRSARDSRVLYTKSLAFYASLFIISFFSEILFTAQYAFLAIIIATVTSFTINFKRAKYQQ